MAITLTVAQLRTALALDASVTDEVDASVTDEVDASVTDEVVASLLAVASELVNKEGGEDAPDAISDEAVILVAAHLEDRIPGRLSNARYRAGQIAIACCRLGRAVESGAT